MQRLRVRSTPCDAGPPQRPYFIENDSEAVAYA